MQKCRWHTALFKVLHHSILLGLYTTGSLLTRRIFASKQKKLWKQPPKRIPIRTPGRYSNYCMLVEGRIVPSPSGHSPNFQTKKFAHLCSYQTAMYFPQRSCDAWLFNVQHLQQTSLEQTKCHSCHSLQPFTKSSDSPASRALYNIEIFVNEDPGIHWTQKSEVWHTHIVHTQRRDKWLKPDLSMNFTCKSYSKSNSC